MSSAPVLVSLATTVSVVVPLAMVPTTMNLPSDVSARSLALEVRFWLPTLISTSAMPSPAVRLVEHAAAAEAGRREPLELARPHAHDDLAVGLEHDAGRAHEAAVAGVEVVRPRDAGGAERVVRARRSREALDGDLVAEREAARDDDLSVGLEGELGAVLCRPGADRGADVPAAAPEGGVELARRQEADDGDAGRDARLERPRRGSSRRAGRWPVSRRPGRGPARRPW